VRSLRIVICITGASGVIYGIKLLETLKTIGNFEVHLVISKSGKKVIELETDIPIEDISALAYRSYEEDDFTAPIASSSFLIDAVIVVPASMKTISAIANGFTNSLVTRVADIALRLKKPLILVPRETPLNAIHLENMLKLARLGATILPACPGFYHQPRNMEDILNFIVGKILDALSIKHDIYKRWKGVD